MNGNENQKDPLMMILEDNRNDIKEIRAAIKKMSDTIAAVDHIERRVSIVETNQSKMHDEISNLKTSSTVNSEFTKTAKQIIVLLFIGLVGFMGTAFWNVIKPQDQDLSSKVLVEAIKGLNEEVKKINDKSINHDD